MLSKFCEKRAVSCLEEICERYFFLFRVIFTRLAAWIYKSIYHLFLIAQLIRSLCALSTFTAANCMVHYFMSAYTCTFELKDVGSRLPTDSANAAERQTLSDRPQ